MTYFTVNHMLCYARLHYAMLCYPSAFVGSMVSYFSWCVKLINISMNLMDKTPRITYLFISKLFASVFTPEETSYDLMIIYQCLN